MRTKKKTAEQEKNRISQKSVKSVRLMGVGFYGGKDFLKIYVFSLEWKSERVMDDDSGDSEEDEGEEDWFRQGWRSEAVSLFQRWGEACRKERFVIFDEELAGGRARVTTEEVRVQREDWREIRLCR